jgi:hypothetical protein
LSYKNIINYNSNSLAPISYVSILDAFRSDYEDNFINVDSSETNTNFYNYFLENNLSFCENCYIEFQNFFRKQEFPNRPYFTSLNLVGSTVQFLTEIIVYHTNPLLFLNLSHLILQTLDTLIDYCLGPCRKNQTYLANNKNLIGFLNIIIRRKYVYDSENKKDNDLIEIYL